MKRILKNLHLALAPVALLLFASATASAWYDPGVQRWINRDPIAEKGGANLYSFVRNQPTDVIDARGLSWISKCAGKICASAIASDTSAEIKGAGIDDRDDRGGGNAFLHCVIACRVAKKCNDAGKRWWDERENPPQPVGSPSRQDLDNNHVGYGEAGQSGSCWDNCMKAWKNGELHCEQSRTKCPPPVKSPPEPGVDLPIPGLPPATHP